MATDPNTQAVVTQEAVDRIEAILWARLDLCNHTRHGVRGVAARIAEDLAHITPPADAEMDASAFLVEWQRGGETWVHAHADEPTAVDQAKRMGGTCTPLYPATTIQSLRTKLAEAEAREGRAVDDRGKAIKWANRSVTMLQDAFFPLADALRALEDYLRHTPHHNAPEAAAARKALAVFDSAALTDAPAKEGVPAKVEAWGDRECSGCTLPRRDCECN